MMRELRRRCAGTHSRHVHLLGGRAAAAAVYPPELVAALVRGIQAQREADARAAARTPLSSEQINAATAGEDDGFLGAAWRAPGATRDEYTGEVLDPALVRQGQEEELKYFRSKHVWRVVPRSRAAGHRIVGTGWVCTNKGDDRRPDVRCRLVAQEVTTYQSEEFFAATPPIETLRMILSLAAEGPSLQVSLVDISRAYLDAKIGPGVYVELPPEAGHGSEYIGQLAKCMYGTRDAAQK